MFRSNFTCYLTPVAGTDVYGQNTFGLRRRESCAIVKLIDESVHSSVRADSTATRGHADEFENIAKILLTKNSAVGIDSKIEIQGQTLLVTKVHRRVGLDGQVDHIEVDCDLWA